MEQATKTVSKKISGLRQRATKLAERVLFATQTSSNVEVRKEGARLSEVMDEWLEDIDELYNIGDASAPERAKSFAVRLAMAEAKVTAWGVPEMPPESTKPNKKKAAKLKIRQPTRSAA